MYHQLRLLGGLSIAVALLATSGQAQTPRRSPSEIGQIIDAALQSVIPSWERHANSTMAEREIRFDFARTMQAFGSADDVSARASRGLMRKLAAGSDSLLVDCDQMGSKACSRLGRSVYVRIEPISASSSEAVVWVHMVWADTSSKRTFKAASSTEVFLSRSGSGPWTFVRLGKSLIS